MTLSTLLLVLVKVTAVFAGALLCLAAMRRATAAMRHLVCAVALAGSLLMPVLPRISPASIPVQIPGGVRFVANAASAHSAGWSAVSVMLAVWLAGTVALLLRMLFGYARLAQMLRGSMESGSAGEVRIVSAEVGVPFVSGLRTPLIALPVAWPEEFREAAVRHELAHVDRGDLRTELLARLACAVYWFHPLVWVTAGRMRCEREAACDDAVLNSGFDAFAYADALVAAARRATEAPAFGCCMFEKAGTTLRSRMTRLLDSGLPRMSTRNAWIRAGVGCAVVLAGIGILIPVRAQNPAAPATHKDEAQATAQASGEAVPSTTTLSTSLKTSLNARTESAENAPPPQEEPTDGVYPVGGEVSPPSVQSKVEPSYTEELKAEKATGTVLLQLVVGADGRPRKITVLESPSDGLSQQAILAVEQWHFVPGERNGEPVSVKAKIEVNFKLQ